MRLSQRRGAFLKRPSQRLREFSERTPPCCEAGAENFRSFRTARKRGNTEFGPELGFGGGRLKALFLSVGLRLLAV